MKKIGFAILGIITAAALTIPVMAEDAAAPKPEKQPKKGEKGDFFKNNPTSAMERFEYLSEISDQQSSAFIYRF